MKQTMRQIIFAAATIGGLLISPVTALAQGLFAPVIQVNDRVITQYEINQRVALLKALGVPGNPSELAPKQLIEDRLKLDVTSAVGLTLTEEGIDAGVAEFAGRANLTPDALFAGLATQGVDRQTFIDFIVAGVSWRELIRARYSGRVSISDGDVDKALSAVSGGSSVRVLLSEIIIPIPPEQEAEVQAVAERISQMKSITEFSSAARKYSATGTRGQGGRLGWMPITNLPVALRPILLGLAPGEVTDPLPFQGAVALFQMRAIEESDYKAPEIAAIEYAAYYIPGGRTEAALATAAKIKNQVNTCDDLYGIAKGQPAEVLERGAKKPDELPRDIAIELAKLDKGEVSTNLTRADGQTLVFLMLCGRTPAIAEDASRDDISRQLRNQQLESYANGFLEELRADARIIYK
ncbi:peptidylprolyl isomerase [Thalassovita taeanensis]|uniref:Parvulin-like PPIase n=1 Tax=Thalassovita taeanensis TaxID=657014 RepID=A0A1H8YZN2_9RHOB|nr:peptidylprolyl isomerase [Thalassovita taeanensis]SEP57497.1 periplasmic chaperone for outer membrane proteins SurA [Thalassovita taeanensis]